MVRKDFLVEIGTEELPPQALLMLSEAFGEGITGRLTEAGLAFNSVKTFATPRRLSVLLTDLVTEQADTCTERRGPSLQAAYDKNNNPLPAATGFARSCGVALEVLDTLKTDKGEWLVYRSTQAGKTASVLLPAIITAALEALPVPRRMRWGARRTEFVRPVHSLLALLGDDIIHCEILGLQADRITPGHRVHSQGQLTVAGAGEYADVLENRGRVIACFATRQAVIKKQIEAQAKAAGGQAVIDADLLNEVTALVEWPVTVTGTFDKQFLRMPAEVLISSMQGHQKYFPVTDAKGKLLPCFICVTNIDSDNQASIIAGNERVLRSRLADAQFFHDTDLKTTLEAKREKLNTVVFQQQLGSVFAKTERIVALAGFIADKLQESKAQAQRAAALCKSDLVSDMVQEFPDLQGVMGRCHAHCDGEEAEVAGAIEEQYLPRFSGDKLPGGQTGCIIAIADRVDTLVGIFGINKPPTGNRDPFALRRAALGVLRILVEKKCSLDLQDILNQAVKGFTSQSISLPNAQVKDHVFDFMLDRFRIWSQNEGISAETFLAVKALKLSCPHDFYQRMQAVSTFSQLPEASALTQANKRVANILAKAGDMKFHEEVDESLLHEKAEQQLFAALNDRQQQIQPLLYTGDYQAALMALTSLKEPVDSFFDQVLINVEEQALKLNRYVLLSQLRQLFLGVADISLL